MPIKIGETTLYRTEKTVFNGKSAILKKPVSRMEHPLVSHSENYMIKREAKLLKKAKEKGVNVPEIYSYDKNKNELIIEDLSDNGKIKIKELKEFHKIKPDQLRKVGEELAKLHEAKITGYEAEPIIKNGKVYFIDFGLSKEKKVGAHDLPFVFGSIERTIRSFGGKDTKEIMKHIIDGYANKTKMNEKQKEKILNMLGPEMDYALSDYVSKIDAL